MSNPESPLAQGGTRQWHALVIGVDRYLKFPEHQLSGCVNDATAVRTFLVERVQIPEANIRFLTSPGDAAPASGATAANAANIRAEFASLPLRVKADDHVVLFYAGHGLSVRRAASGGAAEVFYGFAPEDTDGDETHGYANLILGSEVHELLRSVESRGATATVIADTCHSGASTRGIGGTAGVRSIPVAPLSDEQWRTFTAAHHLERQRPSSGASRGVDSAGDRFGAYPGGDYVMLTGCLDCETSKEDEDHGLLTLELLKELERVAPEAVPSLRWVDFYERLRSAVGERAAVIGQRTSQTPQLEGRREKSVFGGAWRPFAPGFTVRKADNGALTIDGGESQGLEAGAVVAIYPPDTSDFHDAANPGVEAKIASATPATSMATLRDAAVSIADFSRARLVRPSPAAKPIVVRLAAGHDPMPQAMRDAILGDPDSASFFTLVDDGGDTMVPVHAEVRRWRGDVPSAVWPSDRNWDGTRDGWILVATDRFGAASADRKNTPTPDDIVAYLPGAGALVDRIPEANRQVALGGALGRGLVGYSNYLRARDRRAGDDTLSAMLSVKLRSGKGLPPTGASAIAESPVLARNHDGIYVIAEGDWLSVEMAVMRSTTLRLQVGLLGFSDDGNIGGLWPVEGESPAFDQGTVHYVGRDQSTPLSPGRRPDQERSVYTFKVVACTSSKDPQSALQNAGALNLRSLEQPSVQETFAAELAADVASAEGNLSRGPFGGRRRGEQPGWYAWDLRVAVTRVAP